MLDLARLGLRGDQVTQIAGILNGTTNYILSAMEEGQGYAAALRRAQELGFAEADPTFDVSGRDAAQKLVLLASIAFGARLGMKDVPAEGIERVLATTPTRMVVFESPTNPVLKVADLGRITAAARRHGALTLLDNTLAGFHSHGQYDVDIFVHSLTKYASGHGDVMGGAIIARTELIEAMHRDARMLGPVLDPHAAFLMLRGMKTYYLRREAQCRNAQAVAEFLAAHPAVERVRYPGLPGDPGHERAGVQMQDFGTIVTFDLRAGLEAGSRFAESLELFSIAASLGSTESLVVPPALEQPRGLTAEQKAWTGIGPGTVRLSIGVEDAGDLIDDLRRGLDAAAGEA